MYPSAGLGCPCRSRIRNGEPPGAACEKMGASDCEMEMQKRTRRSEGARESVRDRARRFCCRGRVFVPQFGQEGSGLNEPSVLRARTEGKQRPSFCLSRMLLLCYCDWGAGRSRNNKGQLVSGLPSSASPCAASLHTVLASSILVFSTAAYPVSLLCSIQPESRHDGPRQGCTPNTVAFVSATGILS